jgi:serine/threonine protein kinase
LEGGKPTIQTDLWQLGCLIYELYTGKRPFQSDFEPKEILKKIERGIYIKALKEAPAYIQDIVQHLMVRDPHARLPASFFLSDGVLKLV